MELERDSKQWRDVLAATCTLVRNGNSPSSSCTISYAPSSIGSQTIAATYLGDTEHAGSSGTTVLASAPRLVISASPTAITAGDPLTVTVTATDQFGNTYTSYTGTVAFTSNTRRPPYPSTTRSWREITARRRSAESS